jgi:nucleoside phosphorylase
MHDFAVTAKSENKPPTFQDMGGPMLVEVEKIIKDLRAEEAKLEGWNKPESIRIPKPIEPIPLLNSPKLYGNTDWQESVIDSLTHLFPPGKLPRDPEFFSGALITGNTLLKDTALATTWKTTARAALGVEMELGGVCAAARYGVDGDVRVLAIRGISDIVGYKRNPGWTSYACNSAVAFCHAFVLSGLIRR